MAEYISALIADARNLAKTSRLMKHGAPSHADMIDDLADALEAQAKRIAELDTALHGKGGWDEWIAEHVRVQEERDDLAGTLSAIRYRMTGGNITLGRGLTQLDCEHVLESINEALSAPADSPNRARAENHEWRWIIAERPGEVTLTCDCSSVWKHFPIPVGMTMMLPPCPE
ncbi:hypothetical protein ACSBPH_01730 [Microbacterium sp. F51-2R]|uniref:hypothetical protein n=1 Tax=Microbacterium sp. F51-2R TaxID=3445777 RepID=UPI003FA0FF30